MADLHAKGTRERARALIEFAHLGQRDWLRQEADQFLLTRKASR